ncbi:uncharacterized protein LOC110720023 [Chenopodium quinoa]|uniref:DUF4378 domain-containing protein n=1 Tax=Chenopodium quinoa TaxID=63459 RepID=A0A803MTL9_CHEQI|nr:uncharacterized protein LOC110720023 [Chenopodium quinoa]
MAIASTKEEAPRRLSEFLNEQQEPFVLEIYLRERGYRIRKSLELEGGHIGCCSTTSNHNLKNSSSNQNLKKSLNHHHVGANHVPRKSSSISSIARRLVNKIVSMKGRKTRTTKENEVEPANKYSSTSGLTTLSNYTWFEGDTDGDTISRSSPAKNETTRDDKSASDRLMIEWRIVEDNKQCSPDSVLDELDFDAIAVYNAKKQHERTPVESRIRFQRNVSEDAIVSASLWELLVQFRNKPKQQGSRKPFPEYMNSKKALQQNRQLMFDCVREVVENGKQQNNGNRENGIKIGPEEIGKFICRNLKEWGKLSADETNIKQVLKMDLLGDDEWGGSEIWKTEIVAEIGNCIIDDITEQIINDMIDY